jgi:hypothetical protein
MKTKISIKEFLDLMMFLRLKILLNNELIKLIKLFAISRMNKYKKEKKIKGDHQN